MKPGECRHQMVRGEFFLIKRHFDLIHKSSHPHFSMMKREIQS